MKIIKEEKQLTNIRDVPAGSLIRKFEEIYLITDLYRYPHQHTYASAILVVTSKCLRLAINMKDGTRYHLEDNEMVEVIEGKLLI